jgi:riboflavin kinase/FMN adenylyltransferase
MRIYDWNDTISHPLATPTAVTIGMFDGLHLGHQLLIRRIVEKGAALGLVPTVVTFRNHPREVLTPDEPVKRLLSSGERDELLEKMGVGALVLIDFSLEFSKIEGKVFIEQVSEALCPRYMALGYDFRCGRDNSTTAKDIAAWASGAGIAADILGPVLEGGRPISSTRIRHALEDGNTALAEKMLGRYNVNK